MNRSEALSPLNAGEARFPVTAGIGIRGQIRQAAVRLGVDYYEEKGWLESTFIMRGPSDKVIKLKNILSFYGDD